MTWLQTLWHRICFNAWTYARKREISRRGADAVAPIPESSEQMDPMQRRIVGNEAAQLLNNKHFRDAFGAVEDALEAYALACDADNRDKAARIVISKQLLQAIKREIVRKADDGYMAEVEIAEIERKRRVRSFAR
jgi:hypothetical protein